jgi:hypothetical protein
VRRTIGALFVIAAIAAALVAPVNNAYAEVNEDELKFIQAVVLVNMKLRAENDRLEQELSKMMASTYCTNKRA